MPEQTANLESDEHGHDWGSDVERVEHGYAPSLDPANLKTREQREAAARDEAGDAANQPLPKGQVETDQQTAARVNRLRSAPFVDPASTRSVIVNGVSMIVPSGPAAEGASIPPEAQEVLDNTSPPLRTAQIKGAGSGLRTYSFVDPKSLPAGAPAQRSSGTASEAIKATTEATAADADASAERSRASTPAARSQRS